MMGMSATIAEPTARPLKKLLTVADLARMPTELPSGTAWFELNDGVLVAKSPQGDLQSIAQGNCIILLATNAENSGLGEVRGRVGIILRRNPDRVVGPPVSFVITSSLPVRCSPEDYLETVPELVVEIRSKNDSNPEINAKVEEYFQAGVQMVWIVDPAARTLAAHRPDTSVQVFRGDEPVTCDLLPGFAVPAARFFEGT